jgi:hypothetical protein
MSTSKNNNQFEVSKQLESLRQGSLFEILFDQRLLLLYAVGVVCVVFSAYHLHNSAFVVTALKYWIGLGFGILCLLMPFLGLLIWRLSWRYGAVYNGKIVSITSKTHVVSIGAGKIWVLEGKAEVYLPHTILSREIYVSGKQVGELNVGDHLYFR